MYMHVMIVQLIRSLSGRFYRSILQESRIVGFIRVESALITPKIDKKKTIFA